MPLADYMWEQLDYVLLPNLKKTFGIENMTTSQLSYQDWGPVTVHEITVWCESPDEEKDATLVCEFRDGVLRELDAEHFELGTAEQRKAWMTKMKIDCVKYVADIPKRS